MSYWRNCENSECHKELKGPSTREIIEDEYRCPECDTAQSIDAWERNQALLGLLDRIEALEIEKEKTANSLEILARFILKLKVG